MTTTLLDQALAVLRDLQPKLAERGVRHAWIFGSVARGDHRPDSDIDVLVDIPNPLPCGKRLTLFDLGAVAYIVEEAMKEAVSRAADVGHMQSLRAGVAEEAHRDKVRAF